MEWRALVFFCFFSSKHTLIFITERKKKKKPQVIKGGHGKGRLQTISKGRVDSRPTLQTAADAEVENQAKLLLCMSLDCGLEYLERNHSNTGRTCKVHKKAQDLEIESPWPSCREATLPTTAPPWNQHDYRVWIEPHSCYAEDAASTVSEPVYNIDWVQHRHAAVNIESLIVQKNINPIQNSNICEQFTKMVAASPVLPLDTSKHFQIHHQTQPPSLAAAN